LKNCGLFVGGKKSELQLRLKEAMEQGVCIVAESTNVPVADPQNFPSRAYWKTLQPSGEIDDPTSGRFHGPTEDPETRELQPKKLKYDVAFDHPVFSGLAKVPLLTRRLRRIFVLDQEEAHCLTKVHEGGPFFIDGHI